MLASNNKKGVLLTIVAGILWGTSFPAIKIGLQYMDTYTFAFLRFLVALLAMFFVTVFAKNFSFHFDKKRLILFIGLINGLSYLLQYIGMGVTTAAKASLFVNLSVVWVALLSPVLIKERLGGKKILGLTASLLGVVLMTTNLDFSSLSQGTVIGDLLVISAGIGWAFFIVYNKPLVTDSKNMMQSMTWILVFTLIPLIPTASFSVGNFASLPLAAWLAIFYTAIFCWVIPYYFWWKGLKHISAVSSSVLLLTEVIVAVAISTLILGEVLTVVSGVGALLIILAILLVQ